MSETEDHENFFPDANPSKGKLFIDVPSNTSSPYVEKIPFAYDPMEEIQARGMAFRSLSGGTLPWTVLIFSWILFVGIPLIVVITIIAAGESLYSLIPYLFVGGLFILILGRGTKAKLSLQRTQTRRRRRRR